MRVQRVHKVQRVQRGWYRPSGDEYIAALWRQEGLYNRAAPDGNAPLSPPAAVLLLKGSMSLDSQVASLPYESSSFAAPEGESLLSAYLPALIVILSASEESRYAAHLR